MSINRKTYFLMVLFILVQAVGQFGCDFQKSEPSTDQKLTTNFNNGIDSQISHPAGRPPISSSPQSPIQSPSKPGSTPSSNSTSGGGHLANPTPRPTPSSVSKPPPLVIPVPSSNPQPPGSSPSQTTPQHPPLATVPPMPSTGVPTTVACTYYFRIGEDVPGCVPVQNFDDGNFYGPCNGGKGYQYTSNSKYWCAIRDATPHCGQTITATYKGRFITLTVMDECPGCAGDNHVDMSLEALIELTGSPEAACAINTEQPVVTWWFN